MMDFPHSFDISAGVLLFTVAESMSVETTHRIAATVQILDDLQDSGLREVVPSYGSILVIYDISVTTPDIVKSLLSEVWEKAGPAPSSGSGGTVTIDVVYGDHFGEDIANVSNFTGLSVAEVITLHASGTYTVGAVGFAPGFTYLIGLPPELATPRKSTPRLRVPAGSVGIGGAQTGIYALPSSGGWNLIGRTTAALFDPMQDPPVRLRLGDTVRFRSVPSSTWPEDSARDLSPRGDGPIEVLAPGMQTTVQDLGRYGHARYGFATDGAADRAGLVHANRILGNAYSAAALELTYVGPTLRFHRRLTLALGGSDLGAHLNGRAIRPDRSFETMPGDTLTFTPQQHRGARAYLAIQGGFDVPLVLGSASTNLTAGMGGWYGRQLVKGDRLTPGQRALPAAQFTPGLHVGRSSWSDQPLRVAPGPQRSSFSDATWHTFLSAPFQVSHESNRVGLRLLGPSLAPEGPADILSEGIVTGSVQVTGEGQAILMLPGHATIGGYTKIATVIPDDWDRLGQLSPGDTIHFCEE